jgi:hypothetical protein
MAPEAIVTGQVFHPDGTPALEVDVRLLRDTYDERGRRVHSPVSNARTDDRGEYRFFGLPAGEYYLVTAEGAAYSATYFPQTSRRDDALPFGVGAGDTLRLPSLSLQEAIAETPVTFRVPDLMPETRIVRGPTVTTIEGDLPGTVSASFRLLATPADAPIPMETTRRIAPGPLEALLTWSRGEGLGYSYRSLRIGADPLEIDVTTDGPPIHTTGRILTDSEVDVDSVRCQLHSAFFSTQVGDGGLADPGPCYEQDLVPGAYTLEVDRLPPDAYVASASLGGEDILAGRVNVSTSTDLEVVIASPGASISGRILTDAGESLPDSVVVLVPDPPYRDAGPRYRVTTADVQGRYLLRGIAPGNYQLFAWTDLPGAAYRNAEFMSEFEGRGTPIRIEDPIALAVDLTAF